MNVVIRYIGLGIEGIPIKQLANIFRDQDSIKIQMSGKGMIVLSNKKVIKCVKDYYRRPNTQSTSKIKASNQCYYTQRNLDITGIQNYNCNLCHLRCIEMYDNRDLVLK